MKSPVSQLDLERALVIVVFGPASWILPERCWVRFAKYVASLTGRLLPKRRRMEERKIPPFLVDLRKTTPQRAANRSVASWYCDAMSILREYRPGGWKPRIELIGRSNLDDALAGGKGAILWVEEFEFATLVAKMALAREGYSVSHLSRPEHGFSSSPFGRRVFNRLWTRIEDRYLSERITLLPSKRVGSLRRLAELLRRGNLVSITVGYAGARQQSVPFYDGKLRIATGPVTLARSVQAPLLPVFVLRESQGSFTVHLERPLDTTNLGDAPFREFALLLAEYVRQSPETWRGWDHAWISSD